MDALTTDDIGKLAALANKIGMAGNTHDCHLLKRLLSRLALAEKVVEKTRDFCAEFSAFHAYKITNTDALALLNYMSAALAAYDKGA